MSRVETHVEQNPHIWYKIHIRGIKFTHVEQKFHTRTFTHVNYSPDMYHSKHIQYCK